MKSQRGSVLEATRFDWSEGTPFADRRKERRYSTNDPVQVRIRPQGTFVRAAALDVSKSGMRLALDTPVSKGTKIEIVTSGGGAVVLGEVRYCRKSGRTFHAGVLIDNLMQSAMQAVEHLREEEISLLAVGKGLTLEEVLRAERHLSKCLTCKNLFAATIKTLYPPTQSLKGYPKPHGQKQ